MPRLLDAFCKAGGAGMGYHLGGYEVVGIDKEPQPNYPFSFVLGDAVEYIREHGAEYDAIHASPPCQKYSVLARSNYAKDYPDLVEPTRKALRAVGRPYVIENVPGAPLESPVVLCGSMFGLDVRRHRLFESNVKIWQPVCFHEDQQVPKYSIQVASYRGSRRVSGIVPVHGMGRQVWDLKDSARPELDIWSEAMGIDWMTREELSQAIPPLYTKWLAGFLLGNPPSGE